MRWLSRLSVVLIVLLTAIALPTVPAQAVCVPWDVELSPKSGPPGTNVTVSGHDFTELKLVDIYYDGDRVATGRTDSSGDFTLTFIIPEDCRGYYEVEADVGYTTVRTYFTVKPGLTVSPQEGPANTTVTVTGRGFARNEEDIKLLYYVTSDTYVAIEERIKSNAQGSWETTFQIPASTRGEHKIDALGAVSKLYEVKEAVFRVTAEISLDTSSGIAGDTITMTGSRFATNEKDISILFDGEAVVTGIKANSKGEWAASFEVPDMPAGEYSVTAEGAQTRKEDVGELNFDVKPYIVLSPTEGHVGTDVTVSGRGFSADEDVQITYDDSAVTLARTDDSGSFEMAFAAPQSQGGERVITARGNGVSNSTAGLETSASAVFVMESNHPQAPALISPAGGSSLGFMSEVTPTFEWSQVLDDSGVRYRLQIATSEDFSAPSVIVSVADLTGLSYTPPEALPNGTYYWRVQAVDGAENESGWTSAYSFRVGFLPRWGFIAAIVAGVVLFALLIRALVRRRSMYYDRW